MDTPQELALGIDIGTSGVRAITTTVNGEQVSLGIARIAKPLNRPFNWWRACVSALEMALSTADSQAIVAIAVDGTSGTLLAIDGSGQPIGDALMYNESAGDPAIYACLADCVPAGNPAGARTSGLAKGLELQRRPGVASVIHQADWIAGMLTGDFSHSDENNALKTGYDPIQRCWPSWICESGMPLSVLPKVHPVATPTAYLADHICTQFAFQPNTTLYTGTTDGCASFLATGANRNGEAVSALGTTLTLKQLVANPVFDAESGVYSHRIGDLWLAGGASNTGGAVLDQYFSREELESLSDEINTEQLLNLQYYPLVFAGERFPINDSLLEPKMAPRPKTDSLFLQAIFEGIANIEKLGYQRVHELSGTAVRSIRSVGGGATNLQWSRLRQKILGVPFLTAHSVEAAAGSAFLAWQGHQSDTEF